MARRLIECVSNFSEGRDREKVNALVEAVCSVPGVSFLSLEMDADHHRSVLTFAGPPEPVAEAALRAVGKAVELIDLTQHAGVHPRIGAADVVPFVPIEGVTLEDCARIAHQTGMEIWRRFRVPVYFYEAAARRPDRVSLENIRRGQFEGLREEVLKDSERAPDVGDPCLHPTAGATAVGARKYLIAFNINLSTPDVEVARKVAQAIRHSSGGFRFVKAIGVSLASRHLAQVSINLTDFEQTPLHRVFEAVRVEAARHGAGIVGSEIVGLVPRRALEMAADFYLRCENLTRESVLENRLDQEAPRQSLTELVEVLVAPPDRPAAASAAAAATAMAAGLAGTIAAQSGEAAEEFEAIRRASFEAVERHHAALQAVAAARALCENTQAREFEAAVKQAALLSLETAEKASQLLRGLAALGQNLPFQFAADQASARALAEAAKTAALACAGTWIESVADPAFLAQVLTRLGALESE